MQTIAKIVRDGIFSCYEKGYRDSIYLLIPEVLSWFHVIKENMFISKWGVIFYYRAQYMYMYKFKTDPRLQGPTYWQSSYV